MFVKYNWESIFAKLRGGLVLRFNGDKLIAGKDYDIIDIYHTTGNKIIVVVEGKGNFYDRREIHMHIEGDGNKQYIVQDEITEAAVPETKIIPENVRIGNKVFKIERVNAKMTDFKRHTMQLGLCRYDDSVIEVAEVDNPKFERGVFIHECVHGIIDEFCTEWKGKKALDDDGEEQFVQAFADGLYQVMLDNPNIFKVGGDSNGQA